MNTQPTQPTIEPNNPPQPLPQNQEPTQQGTNFPTFKTIHTITRGSNLSFENKKQRQDYYRQVNHVAVEGPITKTKWLHIPITFSQDDIKLISFSHTDAMVITAHIDKWDVMRVLVDNGSQIEILFLSTFEQMGFDRKQLKEASKPLYSFGGRKIEQ
jgi:hypothetical protein